jgi:hypothetical protein
MPSFPLFGLGQTGKSKHVTTEKRINCYAEVVTQPDRTKLAIYQTPGLTLAATVPAGPSRGAWVILADNAALYSVHGSNLYRILPNGVQTLIGVLATTTGRVFFADNGTSGHQLMLVDGVYGYIHNTQTGTFTQLASPFPPAPVSVTYQDTFFIVTTAGSTKFWVSASYDGTSWNAADFAATQSGSGSLQGCLAHNSVLHLFAEHYTEFWNLTGGADFPYSRVQGVALNSGCYLATLAEVGETLMGLFNTPGGDVFVGQLQGFAIQKMSNFEMDSVLRSYPVRSDAIGFSYSLSGHPVYQITFPSAGKSWLLDSSNGLWSELQDVNGSRHWGQYYARWQNNEYVTDYRNGNIYLIDPASYTDNGSAPMMELVSRHLWSDFDFIVVDEVQLFAEPAVGIASGQGVNPQVMMQVSKDQGKTWGIEQWSSLGALGQPDGWRVRWLRQGIGRDWTFRFRITDPVKRVVTGGSIDARKAGE